MLCKARVQVPWANVVLSLCGASLLGHGVLAASADSPGPDKQGSGYLDVGGSRIYYETLGSGPAIVLLHAGLLHAVTWDEVWEPLSARHQAIRYDRRGYGRGERCPGTSRSWRQGAS